MSAYCQIAFMMAQPSNNRLMMSLIKWWFSLIPALKKMIGFQPIYDPVNGVWGGPVLVDIEIR